MTNTYSLFNDLVLICNEFVFLMLYLARFSVVLKPTHSKGQLSQARKIIIVVLLIIFAYFNTFSVQIYTVCSPNRSHQDSETLPLFIL